MTAALPKSHLVLANGVKLHYLDWGGAGPALIMLAGWGCNAYIFSEFAPRFIDQFHVLAMTRRGHGDSDHPETGYDLETLTEDLAQFMDALQIDRAVLVGHSLAGVELSHFAVRHPERVLKLVYLDAAFEYGAQDYKAVFAKNPMSKVELPGLAGPFSTSGEYEAAIQYAYPSLAAIWGAVMHEQFLHEIMTNDDGQVVDRMTGAIGAAISEMVNSYTIDESPISMPVLSIFVKQDPHYFIALDWMPAELQAQVVEWFEQVRYPWLESWIDQFKEKVPQAQVVVIPKGHHYCFLAQKELVYEEMRAFLQDM